MSNDELIKLYSGGVSVENIACALKITTDNVMNMLKDFKENSRYKRSFSSTFKKVVADRDISGVARITIGKELGLNSNTVKKCCQEFGQKNKERASFGDMEYSLIRKGNINGECPLCNSKRINQVEIIVNKNDRYAVYCMSCDNETFVMDGRIYKTNWEYL